MEPPTPEQTEHQSKEGIWTRGLDQNRRGSSSIDEPMEADQDQANTRPGSGTPYSGDGLGGRPVYTRQRPTLYSKRWFTPDLKAQQVEVNQLRRRWQKNYAELGRTHADTTATFYAIQ